MHLKEDKCLQIPATTLFLSLAEPELKEKCEKTLTAAKNHQNSWAYLQQSFLQMIEQYLQKELNKSITANIDEHEAGGQWRIGFPHLFVHKDEQIVEYLKQLMEKRKQWATANLYHGYPDCAEVHHEIETFIYFQMPLLYFDLPGSSLAVESIEDVAHHLGNWEEGVPDWYDWDNHGFTSTWLGTCEVRDYKPYDYQEANHFRFIDLAMAAYLGTDKQYYLDLIQDYSDRWCRHIEELVGKNEPIYCSILPAGAVINEMGHAGARSDSGKDYKVFYNLVADNTSYDIAGALLDVYRITGNERYLKNTRNIIDQFFAKGTKDRPAERLVQNNWQGQSIIGDLTEISTYVINCTFLARLALKHDMITGIDYYRQPILEWAKTINELNNTGDQMMANLLVAAHYYDGNSSWLDRAYAMALRTAAVTEDNDGFHQCNWIASRQGTKFLMEMLYNPIIGGVEWGTRGNIPIQPLKHMKREGNQWESGLPADVSFRTWYINQHTDGFEAINLADKSVEWQIQSNSGNQLQVKTDNGKSKQDNLLTLKSGEKTSGQLSWYGNRLEMI